MSLQSRGFVENWTYTCSTRRNEESELHLHFTPCSRGWVLKEGRHERSSPAAPIVASNHKRTDKGTLTRTTGLTVLRWRITFRGCTWHRKGDKEWVNFAGREWIDRAGVKPYANLITFTHEDTGRRFQSAALAAIRAIAGGSGLEVAS